MSKGFGMLANLKDLNMEFCEKLESLPESTSRLTSHFRISNFGILMSEGFGMLTSLKELWLGGCKALGSLPESEPPLTSYLVISNFGNLMSEGFGDLSNLETLNLGMCRKLELLPASKSRHSESFYFLIFVLRRLRRSQQPEDAQPVVL